MNVAAACDVVASTCAQLAPNGPTIAQYGADITTAAKSLIGAYLDGGPVAWLALLVVLFVFHKVVGFIAFRMFADRKDP